MFNWALVWPKFNRPATGHAATADLPIPSQSFCNADDKSEMTVDGISNRHEQSLAMNHASWFRHRKLSRLARRSLADESEDGYDSLSESPGLELWILLSPMCLYISGETSKRGREGGGFIATEYKYFRQVTTIVAHGCPRCCYDSMLEFLSLYSTNGRAFIRKSSVVSVHH